MKPDHWQKVEQPYHTALEREEGQRATFIKESSPDDEEPRHHNQVKPDRSVIPPLRFPAGSSTSSSAL
jgi:hypothetical protein